MTEEGKIRDDAAEELYSKRANIFNYEYGFMKSVKEARNMLDDDISQCIQTCWYLAEVASEAIVTDKRVCIRSWSHRWQIDGTIPVSRHSSGELR